MESAQDKRTRVVQCALDLIYDKGYNGVGVSEITAAAGIPKGSFFYYFGSKENLAVEAINMFTKHIVEKATQASDDTRLSPVERLNSFFDDREAYFRDHQYTRGCFVGNLCLEMGDVSKPIQKAVETFFEQIHIPIAKMLLDAQAAGELNFSQDPEELAEFIYECYEGALLKMKAIANAEPLERFRKMLNEILLQ